MTAEGYTYAAGRRVLTAYVEFGSPPATAEDARINILDNL